MKLRNIAAIDALRGTAMRQIASYQADLTDAQEDLARATGALVEGNEEELDIDVVQKVVTGRIASAEEGIRRQRDEIIGLNERLDKAISDAGLTDADLSYLNLGPVTWTP
jgi:predicted  nucleic acid-binding Zn-ribbon protein